MKREKELRIGRKSNMDQITLNPRSSEQGFSLPPPYGITSHTITGTVGKALGSGRDARKNLLNACVTWAKINIKRNPNTALIHLFQMKKNFMPKL